VSLGSELAAAREAQGLTLDDVAASTRIRATLIHAIEADDFSGCGGAVYARGHVRSIARAVGLDPEPLLAAFNPPDIAVTPPALPGGLPGGELLEAEHQIARRTKPQGARWGAAMAGALLVIIALAGYGVLHSNGAGGTPSAAGSTSPTVTVSVTPSVADSSPAPALTPSVAPTTAVPIAPPTSAVALVHQSGVTVRLNIIGDRSWFHVANSKGKTLFEGILNKGQTKDFADPKEIRLTIGAPKAVDLVVNGKDIGSLSDKGNVAQASFTPQTGKTASHG
jgi:cytoskeleton protein RodZ